MSCIAIASESHCAGGEIAAGVADRLGYELVDHQLAEIVSGQFDVSADLVRRALRGERRLRDRVTGGHRRAILLTQAVLARLLEQPGLVIRGMATHLIPRTLPHVLRVGIVGERSFRVDTAVEAEGCDERLAEHVVDVRDDQSVRWTRAVLGRRPWAPDLFDLVLPRPGVGRERAIELITEASCASVFARTPRARETQRDFRLATDVSVALLEQASLRAHVTAHDGRVVVRMATRRSPKGALGRTVHALVQESRLRRARAICRAVEGVRAVDVIPCARATDALLCGDERTYSLTMSARLHRRDPAPDETSAATRALGPA